MSAPELRTEFRIEQRRRGAGGWTRAGSAHRYVGHDAPAPERLVRLVEARRRNHPDYDHRLVRRNVTVLATPWEDAT